MASPIPKPSFKARGPRPPRQRLLTTRSPSPFVPSSPIRATPTPTQPAKRRQLICPQPDCRSTDVIEDGGSLYCGKCGAIISEGNPYVSDTQWTETAAGASQVQGQYVGADQTHGRNTAGATLKSGQRLGTDSPASDVRSRQAAMRVMQGFAQQLHLTQTSLIESGTTIFTLAQGTTPSFLSGRSLEAVAAVCLYVACRRFAKHDPSSRAATVMLIDMAEILPMSVFLLGAMYTRLIDKIGFRNKQDDVLQPMSPETLVQRFAKDLEFGNDTRKIMTDAVNIVKRMNRDWMTLGRRPAGICGAAIILAARMNNYRRTVREVVLVAKVTEITISKRLEEFQLTGAGGLTVRDFRHDPTREGLEDMDPPSYYLAQGKGPEKKKRKRGRPRKNPLPETAAELEGDDDDVLGPSAKRVRFDEQGFKIPPIPSRAEATPIDPQLQSTPPSSIAEEDANTHTTEQRDQEHESSTVVAPGSRRQGRPPGSKNWSPPPPTPGELALEKDIEDDLQYVLDHGDAPRDAPRTTTPPTSQASSHVTAASNGDEASSFAEPGQSHPTPSPTPDAPDPSAPIISQWTTTPDPRGPAVNTTAGNTGTVSLSPTITPTEFDDDPEVSLCLLSEAEKLVKERIWVGENAEWLRKDSAKRVRRELKDKERREKGLDVDDGKGGTKRGQKWRRRALKIGDVSYLNRPAGEHGPGGGGDGGAGGGGDDGVGGEGDEGRPKRTFRESVERMMAERTKSAGVASRRVNYANLAMLFGDDEESRSRSRSASVSSTVTSVSVVSGWGSQASGSVRGATGPSVAAQRRQRQRSEKAQRQRDKRVQRVRSATAESMDRRSERDESVATTADGSERAPSLTPLRPATTAGKREGPNLARAAAAAAGAPSPSPSPALSPRTHHARETRPPLPSQTVPATASDESENVDEILGSVDDSPLSSSRNSSMTSPILGVPPSRGFGAKTQRGGRDDGDDDDEHGGSGGDGDDDDESEGDEDDYVDDDVDAAFEGRSSLRRRVGAGLGLAEDEDEDEEVDVEDE